MLCDSIINSVPIGLSDLEIARYLYIELCSKVCFNTTINNTNSKNFYRLYNDSVNPLLFNDTQVNCHTWSLLYSFLLDFFNIKNRIVKYWHSYVVFFIDDVIYVSDSSFGIYSDMSRIHYGDETLFFGPCIYQNFSIDSNIVSFSEEYNLLLNSIDYKIGYLDKILKMKDLKKKLSINKNKFDNIVSKMEFLFSSVDCLSFGYYESKEFIHKLEKNYLNYEETSNIGAIELIRNNSIDSTDILQCIYIKYNDKYKYYILCPNFPIKEINVDGLSLLYSSGFKSSKCIPGFIINSSSDVYNPDCSGLIKKYIKACKKN